MELKQSCLFFVPFLWIILVRSEEDSIVRQLYTQFLCIPVESERAHNLAYTRASGPHDVLHYLITTQGPPAILVARTKNASLIDIKCEHFFSRNVSTVKNSIHFSEDPDYVYVVFLTKLYEYNDLDDVANLNLVPLNASLWRIHNLGSLDLTWADSHNLSDVKENTILLKLASSNRTTDSPHFQGNGSLTFAISLFNGSGVKDELPHLQHTGNSSQLDVIIDRMMPAFANSRYALEMVFLTTDGDDRTMHVTSQRSIDDEHTPGVFEYIDLTSGPLNQTHGSYLQWKPVAYKTSSRTAIEGATRTEYYPLQNLNASHIELLETPNLANAYFGDLLEARLSQAKAINISFGITRDKFYTSTNYSAWSMTVGYGTPPTEQISLLVILVISIGLGIPVIIIIVGGIGVCIRKLRRRAGRSTLVDDTQTGVYTRIN